MADDAKLPVTDAPPERPVDDAVPHLWPGDLDSGYTLQGELGRGGMAVVFRARDRELGRDVAVKVVRPRFAADEEAVARLAREARTVAQLEHPNIVGVYSIRHLSDRSVALVMQLIPGRTLKQVIVEDGPFEPAAAEQVLRDIARALAYAHRAGVVHRDVKPENIFLDSSSGRAMLSDFGVARVMDAPTELTATGTTIGTPTYMAPEQIDGVNLDGRSDLYSLGMVGWEMLTGERPWSGESLYSVIYRQKHDQLSPIDAFRADIPARLQYLIEGLMPKNPDRRWASAARFLTLLGSDQPPPGFKEWESAQKRRRRSRVFQQTRERGGSVIEAALETVKFARPPAPVAPLANPTPTATAAAPADEQFFEPTGEAARKATPLRNPRVSGSMAALPPTPSGGFSIQRPAHQAHLRFDPGAPPPNKRKRLVRLAVGAIGLAGFAALAWMQFGPADTTEVTNGGLAEVPRDNPGIVVPVVNADSLAAAATADSLARLAADSSAVAVAPPPVSPNATPPGDPGAVPNARPGTNIRPNADSARLAGTPARDTARMPVSPPVSIAPTAPVVPSVNFPTFTGTIAAGLNHSCTLGAGGKAVCWGGNDEGQLGDGSDESRIAPQDVASDVPFKQITAGNKHTCGITTAGSVFCWGSNSFGQLGDATTSQSRSAPVKLNSTESFTIVSAGREHTCGLSSLRTVFCWGSNTQGQLGDGSRNQRNSPVAVELGAPTAALTVGNEHTCAITIEGVAWCWGKNDNGQVGDGSNGSKSSPQRVNYDGKFVSIAAGAAHTCAINVDGEAYCWGRNSNGQLGTQNTEPTSSPKQVVSATSFSTLAAGYNFTCARSRDSAVWCWGQNNDGQLGDGSSANRSVPGRIAGVPRVRSLSAGGAHACAVTDGGETWCWGRNVDGQISRESREAASTPVRVLIPAR